MYGSQRLSLRVHSSVCRYAMTYNQVIVIQPTQLLFAACMLEI
jgi:hypothetical protein